MEIAGLKSTNKKNKPNQSNKSPMKSQPEPWNLNLHRDLNQKKNALKLQAAFLEDEVPLHGILW